MIYLYSVRAHRYYIHEFYNPTDNSFYSLSEGQGYVLYYKIWSVLNGSNGFSCDDFEYKINEIKTLKISYNNYLMDRGQYLTTYLLKKMEL